MQMDSVWVLCPSCLYLQEVHYDSPHCGYCWQDLTEKYWEVNKYLVAPREQEKLMAAQNYLLRYEVAFSLFKNEKYVDAKRMIPAQANEFQKQFAALEKCIKEVQ